MRRTTTRTQRNGSTRQAEPAISGSLLPALRKRRSREQAIRIATRKRLLDLIRALETRRGEIGVSRSAIARALGVTQPMISRLFSGQVQNVELRTMVRVAEVLDADIELTVRPRDVSSH